VRHVLLRTLPLAPVTSRGHRDEIADIADWKAMKEREPADEFAVVLCDLIGNPNDEIEHKALEAEASSPEEQLAKVIALALHRKPTITTSSGNDAA
jgi:hypothetical protein